MTVGEQMIHTGLLPRRMVNMRMPCVCVRAMLSASCSLALSLSVWLAIGDAAELGVRSELIATTELPMAHDEYVYMIRFSPDGQTMVTAAGDNVARIWNWSTKKPLHTLSHEAAVYAAEFSPVGEHLATGSGDGNVTLWRLSTGTQIARHQEHADAVYCVNFSPDGTQLASIGGDGKRGDTKCRIWSVPALKIVNVLPGHERPGYGVLFGPTVGPARDTLLTSGGDKLIHLFSLPTGKRRTWIGHTSDVYRSCFSPDGQHLASTSQDGSVRLWNVATGELEKTLLQIKDPIYDVAYARDGSILAAVGDDGFVRYWETRTYTLLAESKTDPEGLYSVVFTPDQIQVITGGVRGVLQACSVPGAAEAAQNGQRQVDKDATDATRR